jgi:hypothetical protein
MGESPMQIELEETLINNGGTRLDLLRVLGHLTPHV